MNKSENMVNQLFVYGTLCPGRPNEHILANIGGTWQPGSIKGKLLSEGWGAALGYPGVLLDEAGDPIEGFLFQSANLPKHWNDLDAFEGAGYERVLTKVQLERGVVVEAFVYALRELSLERSVHDTDAKDQKKSTALGVKSQR